MYISLSMDSYKYALTTSVKRTSNPLEIARALSYKYSFVLNKLYTIRRLDYKSKKFHFINKCNAAFISFFHFG